MKLKLQSRVCIKNNDIQFYAVVFKIKKQRELFICNKSFPDKKGKCVFENELLQSHSVIYDQDYQTISKIPLRSSSTSSPLLKVKTRFLFGRLSKYFSFPSHILIKSLAILSFLPIFSVPTGILSHTFAFLPIEKCPLYFYSVLSYIFKKCLHGISSPLVFP